MAGRVSRNRIGQIERDALGEHFLAEGSVAGKMALAAGMGSRPSGSSAGVPTSINEDASIFVSMSDLVDGFVDPDNGHLFISDVQVISGGTASRVAALGYSFAPTANFTDEMVVDVSVSDGTTIFTSRHVIDILPQPDAPTAPSVQSVEIDEDVIVPVIGLVGATDIDNDPLAYSIKSAAANGTARVNSRGFFTYLPNANYSGADSFVIRIDDGTGLFVEQRIDVDVKPQPDGPQAPATQSVAIDEDAASSVVGNVGAIGEAGAVLTYSIKTAAGHGTASVDASGNISYTPDADYHGADSFIVLVEDQNGGKAGQKVIVDVVSIADAPTGADVTREIDEDHDIPLTAGDFGFSDLRDRPDEDSFAAIVITAVKAPLGEGTLQLNGVVLDFSAGPVTVSRSDLDAGRLIWVSAENRSGRAEIIFKVMDDASDHNLALVANTLTLAIAGINDAPEISASVLYRVNENLAGASLGALSVDDVEGDAINLAFFVKDGMAWKSTSLFVLEGGILKLAAGKSFDFETTPVLEVKLVTTDANDVKSSDEAIFVVSVGDVSEGSSPPTGPVNQAPRLLDAIADQTLGSGATLALNIGDAHFTDPDGTDLTYKITVDGDTEPSWITFDKATGALSIRPTNYDVGEHRVVITASDGSLAASDEFVLIVTNPVTPVNPKGTRGNDHLVGDAGDNILNGRRGNDRLFGGEGADLFVLGKNFGRDRVIDFNPAEGDQIDLSRAIGIDDFFDLMSGHIQVIQSGVKIITDDGSTLVLKGFDANALSTDMFLF